MKEVNITQEDYGFGYLDLGQAFKDEDGEHIPETPLENLNQHEVPLIVENSNNPILPIQDPVSEADDLENFFLIPIKALMTRMIQMNLNKKFCIQKFCIETQQNQILFLICLINLILGI